MNNSLLAKPKCLLEDPTLDQSTKCVLKRFLMPSGDVVEIVLLKRKPQYTTSDRTTSDTSNLSFIDKLEQELKSIAPKITTRKKVVLVDPTSTQNENIAPKKYEPSKLSPPQSIIKKNTKLDQASEISFNDSIVSRTSKRSINFDSSTPNSKKNSITEPLNVSNGVIATQTPISNDSMTQQAQFLSSEINSTSTPSLSSTLQAQELTSQSVDDISTRPPFTQVPVTKKKCKLLNRPRRPLVLQERPPSPIIIHSIIAVPSRQSNTTTKSKSKS